MSNGLSYYNEIDPYAAQWLRNLIEAGHLAQGIVDTRSIEDVRPEDIAGFTQCHFFAGIGGWPLALDLAGWPRSRPVWTGSCPCQPFSAAGKGAGFADERHLWPAWQHLIAQCRPTDILGEQVASKAAELWIDLIHADMEGMAYAFGCIPFPAAGVGAPHIRDRTYWGAANTDRAGLPGGYWHGQPASPYEPPSWGELAGVHATSSWATWVSESGAGPLVDGVPGRVGQTRAYGNGIVIEAAVQFILAYAEARGLIRYEQERAA